MSDRRGDYQSPPGPWSNWYTINKTLSDLCGVSMSDRRGDYQSPPGPWSNWYTTTLT